MEKGENPNSSIAQLEKAKSGMDESKKTDIEKQANIKLFKNSVVSPTIKDEPEKPRLIM